MITQSMMEQGSSSTQMTAQYSTFSQVHTTIEDALGELTENYSNNSMRANPDKTQVEEEIKGQVALRHGRP